LLPVSIPERSRNLADHRDADMQRMSEGVRAGGSDLGVLLADDGQLAAFFDEHGRLVPAVSISKLVARTLINAQQGSTIVVERNAASELQPFIEAAGGTCLESGVLCEEMSLAMSKHRAVFGCGSSGRLWFGETFPTCDALISMARVLESLSQSDAPFSDVLLKLTATASAAA
jgi:phosphomannomutase